MHTARVANLGERIQEGRTRRGLSQQEFAARVGRTQATVSRWETGKLRPAREVEVAVANELMMPWQVLFYPEGDR